MRVSEVKLFIELGEQLIRKILGDNTVRGSNKREDTIVVRSEHGESIDI